MFEEILVKYFKGKNRHLFKYLFVDADKNLRILLPIEEDATILLDNTCQALASLQSFFQYLDQDQSIFEELDAYKQAFLIQNLPEKSSLKRRIDFIAGLEGKAAQSYLPDIMPQDPSGNSPL